MSHEQQTGNDELNIYDLCDLKSFYYSDPAQLGPLHLDGFYLSPKLRYLALLVFALLPELCTRYL